MHTTTPNPVLKAAWTLSYDVVAAASPTGRHGVTPLHERSVAHVSLATALADFPAAMSEMRAVCEAAAQDGAAVVTGWAGITLRQDGPRMGSLAVVSRWNTEAESDLTASAPYDAHCLGCTVASSGSRCPTHVLPPTGAPIGVCPRHLEIAVRWGWQTCALSRRFPWPATTDLAANLLAGTEVAPVAWNETTVALKAAA